MILVYRIGRKALDIGSMRLDDVLGKLIFIFLIVIGFSCTNKKGASLSITTEAYKAEIDTWHSNRESSLQGEDGWLNLAGLFWLKEGINTFGSGEMNDLVFPEGAIPDRAGFFVLSNGVVKMQAVDDVKIMVDSVTAKTSLVIFKDSTATIASYGSLRWFVIQRGNAIGIRLRNIDAIGKLGGIARFPVDVSWRLEAVVEKYSVPKKIDVANVLGRSEQEVSPGTLIFRFDGKEYKLDALDGGASGLFVIFGDATNDKETYASGRYVYVDRPDVNGRIYIDFNKAHNPPCAFTPFATCPLPPLQNILDIEIRAGEKEYTIH